MGTMLVVAVAVPDAFGDDAVLFGVAYLVVRLLHLVVSAPVASDDPDSRGALLRFAPTAIVGASLLVVSGFVDDGRIATWITALAIDYLGPIVIGIGRGWAVAAEHFAERYGLIVLIALGESIIAIGFGAGPDLNGGVLAAVALGVVLVSALWWLYFDVAAIFARGQLQQVGGVERARLARDSYAYLHLPMVAGIVLLAFGVERMLHDVAGALDTVPRWRSVAASRSTCSDTSRSFSGRPTTSSGVARWRRRWCSPRPHPGRGPAPAARHARPRQRRVLAGRRVRGDPPSRRQDPGPTPRARWMTRTVVGRVSGTSSPSIRSTCRGGAFAR